ncbi:hypothetical protein [Sphingomonas sp. TWP1-3-1]|uniref:hypothetical protein n=1 Tax=Sphingomonas sp. TWP1-3-1 TaxID=2804612 RepID=UPI003CEC432E
MAELRSLAGSALTRAVQKNRQLWFGVGGVAAGILASAILPGLVAREIAPASWLWPERMAARTLRFDTWTASRRLAEVSQPTTSNTKAAGVIVIQKPRGDQAVPSGRNHRAQPVAMHGRN